MCGDCYRAYLRAHCICLVLNINWKSRTYWFEWSCCHIPEWMFLDRSQILFLQLYIYSVYTYIYRVHVMKQIMLALFVVCFLFFFFLDSWYVISISSLFVVVENNNVYFLMIFPGSITISYSTFKNTQSPHVINPVWVFLPSFSLVTELLRPGWSVGVLPEEWSM